MKTEFEERRVVIISQGVHRSACDRLCDISGEEIFEGQEHYSIGYVDRFEGRSKRGFQRLHVTMEVGELFKVGAEDVPLFFREWLKDNRFIEDDYCINRS